MDIAVGQQVAQIVLLLLVEVYVQYIELLHVFQHADFVGKKHDGILPKNQPFELFELLNFFCDTRNKVVAEVEIPKVG